MNALVFLNDLKTCYDFCRERFKFEKLEFKEDEGKTGAFRVLTGSVEKGCYVVL